MAQPVNLLHRQPEVQNDERSYKILQASNRSDEAQYVPDILKETILEVRADVNLDPSVNIGNKSYTDEKEVIS